MHLLTLPNFSYYGAQKIEVKVLYPKLIFNQFFTQNIYETKNLLDLISIFLGTFSGRKKHKLNSSHQMKSFDKIINRFGCRNQDQ
jgi:hypothetical protein